jgi:hypothetical protein
MRTPWKGGRDHHHHPHHQRERGREGEREGEGERGGESERCPVAIKKSQNPCRNTSI